MKYKFSRDFDVENLRSSTFVSALNFPKIISSGIVQKNLLYFVDGNLMQLILFIRKGKLYPKRNFDFSGLADDVFKKVESHNHWTIGIAGGSESDNKIFTRLLERKYPLLHNRILGIDGYLDEALIEKRLSKSDIIILGLGSPKQESLAERLLSVYPEKIVLTCGAFVSQTAKQNGAKYYPALFKILNLRWLFRAFNEKGHYKRLTYALLKSLYSFKHIR